jgi:ribosomal protein S18
MDTITDIIDIGHHFYTRNTSTRIITSGFSLVLPHPAINYKDINTIQQQVGEQHRDKHCTNRPSNLDQQNQQILHIQARRCS